MQLENGVSDDFKWHGSWSGDGIEVDRVYACAGIAVLFFTFLFQEYGTVAARTRKGMSGQAAISYLAGLSVICIAAYHFDSGSDLRCILSFLWKWYGKWKCFPDYVGKSAAYASLS